MKRLNPVGSVLGIILTTLLFMGLGISLWSDRGLAFSPGPVTATSQVGVVLGGYTSHADFEKQCGKCHDPFKSKLATKCVECHLDVSEQIRSEQGAHSQIATTDECISCHPEHRGRDFNPTLASFKLFDHSKTSFSLIWHQENFTATPLQCNQCHTATDYSSASNQTCLECHTSHDSKFSEAHVRDYGSDCLGCHDGLDRMKNFDHSQTGFALDGKHLALKCTDCHTADSVKDVPRDCQGCHAEPAIHTGLFTQTCNTCHTAEGWSPASLQSNPFDHLETTGFSLKRHPVDYSNQAIKCTTCHPQDLQSFELQTCIGCHSQHDETFMTDHVQQFGSDCLACHDGVDRLSDYQHANFFALDGKHATLQCADCHPNQVFRGTATECWQCHKEPEIHAGVFGLKCYYCHDAQAWSPASLRQHIFPLNHGLEDQNAQLECTSCHGTNYVDYTCYNCHDHPQAEMEESHMEKGIPSQDLPACAKCHPNGALSDNQPSP